MEEIVKRLTRSEQMSRIRGKDTGPEVRLRRALWAEGLRYRLHVRTPIGRPDIIFQKFRICVFVDGCFWHGCPMHYVLPRTRRDFWLEKLRVNVLRDRRQTLELQRTGWTVLRIWEHNIFEDLQSVVEQIKRAVRQEGSGVKPYWRVERVEVLDEKRDLERRHLVSLLEPAEFKTVECIRSTVKWRIQ